MAHRAAAALKAASTNCSPAIISRTEMYQETRESRRTLYLKDERPWLVGFSGKNERLV
jgi:hypothetical protein